jgi:hypothetical protein
MALECRPRVIDNEILTAFAKTTPEVLRILLKYRPLGKLRFPVEKYFTMNQGLLTGQAPQEMMLTPFAAVAARFLHQRFESMKSVIALLRLRGENINEPWSPLGTVLHSDVDVLVDSVWKGYSFGKSETIER